MPIRELNVCNFKSYGGVNRIGPFKTFSAVIGPNGSGKSNVMDAIGFVLGIRSNQLRGAVLKDLIHTKATDDNDSPNARDAYVEIVYDHTSKDAAAAAAAAAGGGGGSDSDSDNSSTNRRAAAATTTVFRRTIRSSGTSQYMINGRVVSWKEYEQKLGDIGVVVKAKNFMVFQGDVVSIAQKNPAQLTELVEQISGSAQHRDLYDRLKARRDAVEEEFHRTFERKRTMQKEEKQVRVQAQEAEKFQELLVEKRAVETEFYLWQLYHVDKDVREHTAQTARLQAELKTQQDDADAAERDLKAQLKTTAGNRRTVSEREKAIGKLRRQIENMRPEHIKLQAQKAHLEKALVKSRQVVGKLEAAYDKDQGEIDALLSELAGVEAQQQAFEDDVLAADGENKELNMAQDEMRTYHELKEEAGRKTAPLRADLERFQRELTSLEDEAETLGDMIGTLKDRKKLVTESIVSLADRETKMGEHVQKTQTTIDELRARLANKTTTHRQAATRATTLTKELTEVSSLLQDAKADRRETEREGRMRETLETLKRLYPGVRGRVQDLCSPVAVKYNLAVTVAMGMKNIEAVVVDEEKTALDCVQYMKEQRLGRATFIPLGSIVTPPLQESNRLLGGSAKLLYDVIDIEASCQRALLYVCGNTVICDTLEEARQLSDGHGHFKIVTLDGTVIHKNGNMTGGVGAFHERANRWDEKEVAALRTKRDNFVKELAELEQRQRKTDELRTIETQLSGLESRMAYSQKDFEVTRAKLVADRAKAADIDAEVMAKVPQLQRVRSALGEAKAHGDTVRKKVQAVETKIFVDFSRQMGVVNIGEYEEKRVEVMRGQMNRRKEFADHIAKLRNQLEYERARHSRAKVDTAGDKVREHEAKIKTVTSEEKARAKSIRKEEGRLAELQAELKELKRGMDGLAQTLKTLKIRHAEQQQRIIRTGKSVTKEETELEKLINQRHDIIQLCKVQQIDLPTTKAGTKRRGNKRQQQKKKKTKKTKAKTKAKAKRRRKQGDDESSSSSSGGDDDDDDDDSSSSSDESKDDDDNDDDDDDNEYPLDFSELTEHLDIGSADAWQRVKNDYVSRVESINDDIRKLAPNLKAIDHYHAMEERLKDYAGVFQEKKQEMQTVAEEFDDVAEKRGQLFIEAFQHLERQIDAIYRDLTKSEGFPGGTAYLTLENTDEPYLHGVKYTAMPPAKRFCKIDELSGGEKTLAALALLFAIHSYRPAPFFVLDEVDAALDLDNIHRISNYIRSRTRDQEHPLQCIVISLKDSFYTKADALVGVYRDQQQHQSGVLTLDLQKFDDDDNNNNVDNNNNNDNNGKYRQSSSVLPPAMAATDDNSDDDDDDDDEDSDVL